MKIKKEITDRFSSLVEYTEKIKNLNGGSGTALVIIHKDKIVTEYYSGAEGYLHYLREFGDKVMKLC